MEIVFHVGAHCTDEDRIIRTLLRNRAALAEEGIVVPLARHYRYLFRDLIARLDGARASPRMQELVLDAVMVQDRPRRVVFGHEMFLGLRSDALGSGRLYPGGAARVAQLRNIFPDHAVSFCLGIRDPATFLPALHAASEPAAAPALPGGIDPLRLSWSALVAEMRAAVPDCAITVWCDEDLPLIWPAVLRAVSGHGEATRLEHLDEFLAELMLPEGVERMQAYFADNPPESEARRRRAVAAFLERFGRPERLEVEIDMPGWTQEHVAAITAAYEADVARIAAIPGVRFIG
ncbi:MAG: hypothetical protein N2Z62_11200 [Rhodobacteraceae bacterium]|nr:hypothetical protein [Paracoccaceae bacterium]